jgi:hypothetical protein
MKSLSFSAPIARRYRAAAGLLRSRIFAPVLIGVALLAAAGFAWPPGSDDPFNPSQAAIERFWQVYHGNDYSEIPQVEEQLLQAIQLDPRNPTLHALLGAAHFWHIGEAARDLDRRDPALVQDMPDAVAQFGQALGFDYYTRHLLGYINDDHLPGYLGITTVHLGQIRSDPALIAKGDQILDFAAYQFPEFNNFNRWAARNSDSRDSASYREALDSLWQGLDACAGTTVDRTDPDLKPYLGLLTSVGRKKACWWQGDLAPYSFEGYMLNLGNGLLKAGQVDQARIIFRNAHYAANYDTWPYRAVLDSIENSDLEARAALYADNNPTNDPPLGVPTAAVPIATQSHRKNDRQCRRCGRVPFSLRKRHPVRSRRTHVNSEIALA